MLAATLTLLLAAAPDATPAGKDPTVQAKEAYAAGQALYKKGKFAEAVVKFEEAFRAKPHPTLPFNIAKCYEQLGDDPKTLRAYRDYLRLDPSAKDASSVRDSVANLERRLREKGLQQVLVFAEPSSALIEIDGKIIGASPASTELTAGEHTLTVKADGYQTATRSFTFSIAHASELTVELKAGAAAPPPPPPPVASTPADAPVRANTTPSTTSTSTTVVSSTEPGTASAKKPRVWTWVAAGVAVAGAGAGVGLGLAANGTAAKLTQASTPQPDRASADALASAARGQALGANISYGVAGAAAITAVVLFFLEK